MQGSQGIAYLPRLVPTTLGLGGAQPRLEPGFYTLIAPGSELSVCEQLTRCADVV